jgi:SAM-dependent methyltransferase
VELAEYDKLDTVEDCMWWFAALHRNLLTAARRLRLETRKLPMLDAGCGTGGFLVRLGEEYPDRPLLGLDLNVRACSRAAVKSRQPICAGSANDLPFADGSIAVIFTADLLCHERVDEVRTLRQFHRCLVEHGFLILNLPAYPWLLSRHDAAVHNARRYTASGLRRLLHAAGFHPIFISYWNAILFPLIAFIRKLFPRDPGAGSDVRPYPYVIDAFCRGVTAFETMLLWRGVILPFGGSVLAVAAKGGACDE